MTIIAFRSVIHESTLNIKVASCCIYSMVNITTTTEDAHQQIQWVGGRGQGHHHHHHHHHSCCCHICACIYLSQVVGKRYACICIPLCASHGNVMRACTNAILSGPCNAWLMDGWLWLWQWWYVVRSCERVMEGRCWIEWMHACMDWQLFVCVCVYVCGWLVPSTYLQSGAFYISHAEGTFTNCNFTSNSATNVSLEEEHVDDCEMSKCMTLSLCPQCISSWLTHPCFLYRFTVIVSCDRRSVLISLIFLLWPGCSLPLRVHV